eukprot:125180-Hanusia_phi.AAC.3
MSRRIFLWQAEQRRERLEGEVEGSRLAAERAEALGLDGDGGRRERGEGEAGRGGGRIRGGGGGRVQGGGQGQGL